jgi:signal transduction histidine kinase
MLNNLLTWAATQREGMAADIARIEPGGIVKEIIQVFRPIAAKKNVEIVYDDENAQPLLADENQLRIIVQNLLNNAIKFTPAAGKVSLFFSVSAKRVYIHVKDTGIGMGKEKQEQLFKDFGAAITSYGTAKEKGTGIGLMIVKEFANQNNGIVTVTSEKGRGTTFSISFPAAGL